MPERFSFATARLFTINPATGEEREVGFSEEGIRLDYERAPSDPPERVIAVAVDDAVEGQTITARLTFEGQAWRDEIIASFAWPQSSPRRGLVVHHAWPAGWEAVGASDDMDLDSPDAAHMAPDAAPGGCWRDVWACWCGNEECESADYRSCGNPSTNDLGLCAGCAAELARLQE